MISIAAFATDTETNYRMVRYSQLTGRAQETVEHLLLSHRFVAVAF